jgi:hypothetical protein
MGDEMIYVTGDKHRQIHSQLEIYFEERLAGRNL